MLLCGSGRPLSILFVLRLRAVCILLPSVFAGRSSLPFLPIVDKCKQGKLLRCLFDFPE
jgi:hypothetical protein